MSTRRNGHFWKPQPLTDDPVAFLLAALAERDDLAWQDLALCAQTDPEAFFPEKGGCTRSAKAVCRSCEVRTECLQYALDRDERFGIWGGKSERERRTIRRQQAEGVAA